MLPKVGASVRARMIGPMRFAVDRERARSANSFAAIGIKSDRFLAAQQQVLVHDIEHFEDRCVWRNVGRLVIDELSFRLSIFLTPDLQFEIHL